MKIAISAAENQGLQSLVAEHFGRCPFYVLVDLETEPNQVETIANPYFQGHEAGMVPAFIHQQGVNVMISGGMGRRALQFFEEYNIEVATGACGTVQETLTAYLEGKLQGGSACKESENHHH
jgi:predicted Fe-Mo cluster-binding NifX family protein